MKDGELLALQQAPRPAGSDGAAPQQNFIWETALLVTAIAGLAVGGVLELMGGKSLGRVAFVASVITVLIPTLISTARRLLRGEFGVDLIAVLAMSGALALGEFLAGAIIAVMLSGGRHT